VDDQYEEGVERVGGTTRVKDRRVSKEPSQRPAVVNPFPNVGCTGAPPTFFSPIHGSAKMVAIEDDCHEEGVML